MKKIILTLIAMIAMFNLVISQEVKESEAFVVANQKLYELSPYDDYVIISNSTINTGKINLFYTYVLSPTGYIIVSGNKNLPPVIAYSLNNSLMGQSSNNQVINLVSEDIKCRLENIQHLPQDVIESYNNQWQVILNYEAIRNENNFTQWPPDGTTTTGGWIETNYTQSSPYNQFCPDDPVTGTKSYVGCPATAMAQIMNYYRTLNSTSFNDNDDYYHSYAGRNYWIDNDYQTYNFISFSTINECLDTISIKYENELAISDEDAAALSFACGVAANQVFTSEGSGTFGVDQAYQAFQRFGFNESVLLYPEDTSLFSTMSQNMKDARPVLLAMVNESFTSGHNVVVDGYNTDDFYHINFGWGGGYNGWYKLPEQFPLGLTVIEGLIAEIAYPQTTTNTDNSKITERLFIYPNPTTSKITFEIDPNPASSFLIKIFDNSGRLMLYKQVADNHSNKVSLDLQKENLSTEAGLYFVIVEEKNKKHSGSFIVK